MQASQSDPQTDRLLPFAKAQGLVGISRSQIYVLLDQGAFPAPTKIGRCNYFSEQELRAWIEEMLSMRLEGKANAR